MVSGGHLTPLDLENFLKKLLLAAGEFFAGIFIIALNLLKVYSIQTDGPVGPSRHAKALLATLRVTLRHGASLGRA